MSQKIRIVSGGLGSNTRVYDVDGNEIDHVSAVSWQVRAGELARATLEIERSDVHVWADARLAESHPCDILAAIRAEMLRQREMTVVQLKRPPKVLVTLYGSLTNRTCSEAQNG